MILSQSWQMKMIYEPTLLLKVYCYACMVWQGYIAIEGPSVYCHCNVAPKRSHYLLKRAIIQFLILPIWTGDTIKESCVKSLIVARPYNAARTLFYRGATSLYICMWSHMLPGGSDRGGQGGLEATPQFSEQWNQFCAHIMHNQVLCQFFLTVS